MKMFMILLRAHLAVLVAGIGGKSRQKRAAQGRRGISGAPLLLLLVALFSFYSWTYSQMLATALAPLGMMELQLALMAVLLCVLVAMTSVQGVQNSLFRAKDLDLLMSLPVPPWIVLASKITAFMLYEFIYAAVVMIPAAVVYASYVAVSPVFFIYIALSIPFLPLIPVIVATIVGSAFTWISAKLRIQTLLNNLLGILFVLGIMLFSFNLNGLIAGLATAGSNVLRTLSAWYPPVGLLVRAFTGGSPLDFLGFVLCSILPFCLFLWVLSRLFRSITSAAGAGTRASRRGGTFTLSAIRARSPLQALFSREVSRYFAVNVYFLNTAFGVILVTVGAVALLVMGREVDAFLQTIPELRGWIPQLVAALVGFLIMTTCTTSCSISLEGENLPFLKSLPVSAPTFFLSKILLGAAVLLPLLILDILLVAVRFSISPITTGLLILTAVAGALLNCVAGLLVNLAHPNLDWQTETVAVKQSMSVMLAMLLNSVFVAVPALLYLVLLSGLLTFDLFLLLVCAAYALLLWLLWRRLITKGAARLLAL